MTAYYNEIDPYAAQWLRNLISAGLIAPGDVDERDIRDVKADEVKGYAQCHFFAGIAGWSRALRLARWNDERPVWTGSCPCQPFSAAGKGASADDERHLWPAWASLIKECRPRTIFGEQVEPAIGWGWLDLVFDDLEAEGYACGAAVLPACSVGAPHIRNRLWFVADARYSTRGRRKPGVGRKANCAGQENHNSLECRSDDDSAVADADGRNASTERLQRSGQHRQFAQDSGVGVERVGISEVSGGPSGTVARETPVGTGIPDSGSMVDATSKQMGVPGRARQPRTTPWSDIEWLPCRDGKARPVKPEIQPLATRIPARMGKLRAAGNSIVPQVAAQFIEAVM